MNDYLRDEHSVVVDAGCPLLGAQNLKINRADGFISAAAWLSIGMIEDLIWIGLLSNTAPKN